MANDEARVLLHNRIKERIVERNIQIMTDENTRLPVAAIAPRVGVVHLINTLAADRTVAVVCRILVRPSRFIIGNGRVWVDGSTADALKFVAIAGCGRLYFLGSQWLTFLFIC